MKNIFIKAIAVLVCVCCVSMGWTQTLGKDYSLFGVPLGTEKWHEATTFNSKGEIFWDADEYPGLGWNLSGINLSRYSGIRVEANSGKTDVYMKLCDVETDSQWDFLFDKKGVAIINFNGVGNGWHDGPADELDASKGCKILFVRRGGVQTKDDKTVIKKVEFIEATGEDYSYLNLLGKRFGTNISNASVNGNEITWKKGYNDYHAGWNLADVDLSEYTRIRIELENNEMGDFEITLWNNDWGNYHTFGNAKVAPNVYEANLSGEGCTYKSDDAVPFDLSKGMRISIHKWLDKKKLTSNKKTVIKSVTLIKEANVKLKEFDLLGAQFGSAGWNYYFSDQAEICWEKGKGGECGWDLNGVDLTPYAYKKVRIELEYTDIPVHIFVAREEPKFYSTFKRVAPNIFEVSLTGKNAGWKTSNNEDLSNGLRIVFLKETPSKGTEKTVVKSVSLVDDYEPSIPNLNLAGVNLGTYRDGGGSYVENDNKIVWREKTWSDCGWDLEGIDLTETPVVSIELESTDVPVRIYVRQSNSEEGRQYWYNFKDTPNHCIQIDLRRKEGWNPVKKSKVMIDGKSEKSAFDISKGAVIYISPETNPYKPNQTTVVRKAELLKTFTK